MRRTARKGKAARSRRGIWPKGIALGAGVLVLVMAYVEFSQLRGTNPPFVATVRAPVYATARGMPTIELPGGGIAILSGFVARKYVKGDRVLVQELTTPILGLHRYVLAPAGTGVGHWDGQAIRR